MTRKMSNAERQAKRRGRVQLESKHGRIVETICTVSEDGERVRVWHWRNGRWCIVGQVSTVADRLE